MEKISCEKTYFTKIRRDFILGPISKTMHNLHNYMYLNKEAKY